MSLPHGRRWAWHVGILVALRIGIGAIGFQLDKYSLAFSQRAYPYPSGVDATDAAVRIPAADILTVLTVRGRRGRVPGHRAPPLRVGRGSVRRVARGRDRGGAARGRQPGAVRESQPAGPGAGVHRQRHQRHPARLRRGRLDVETLPGHHRPDRRRAGPGCRDVRQCPPVGLPAPGRDPRPAPDRAPVLRLHGRGHRPLHHRRQAAAGDAVGARDGAGQEPDRQQLAQRALRVHARLRRGDGARERGPAGRPAGPHHPGPAGRLGAGRAGHHRAAHLLRRASVALGRDRAPRPTSSTTPPTTRAATPPRAGRARPASTSRTASTACC